MIWLLQENVLPAAVATEKAKKPTAFRFPLAWEPECSWLLQTCLICPKRCVGVGNLPQKYTSEPASFALPAVHVFVRQYVLQREHCVLLAVSVGRLQVGEHGSDLPDVMRYVHLSLIGFQDRVLGTPRLRPVDLALVLFCGLTDDQLDACLAAFSAIRCLQTGLMRSKDGSKSRFRSFMVKVSRVEC